MSSKISYILEVLDGYSKNTRKFRKEVGSLESCLKSLNNQLNISSLRIGKLGSGLGLNQTIRQTDSLRKNIDNLNRASQKSVNIFQQQSRVLGRSRKAYAGAFTPIKFNPYEGKYQPVLPPQPRQLFQTQPKPSGFFSGADVSFKAIAKSMGYYRAIDMAISVPSKIHDVTIEMDSLRAGLAALIPTVKGMKGATSASEVEYLRSVAQKYGADFSTIAPSYLKLLGTGGASDAPLIKGLLENISGYAGIINLSGPAFERTMLGFQDMLSKQVLNAQEVNLQLANLPGAKPMMHEAFRRFANKKGMTEVTSENASKYFAEAMRTGKLPSVDILREFVVVMQEVFGEEMIKKSFTLGREEKRLKNAFQELGDQLGLLTYDLQVGTIRDLTGIVKQVDSSLSDIVESFKILDDTMKDNALYKIAKGSAKGLGTVLTEGVGELIKAPFKTASAAGGVLAGYATGDFAGANEVGKEWVNYYFSDVLKRNLDGTPVNENNEPQKIEITIKSDNNVKVQDVKSNRPSTVRAGQR